MSYRQHKRSWWNLVSNGLYASERNLELLRVARRDNW